MIFPINVFGKLWNRKEVKMYMQKTYIMHINCHSSYSTTCLTPSRSYILIDCLMSKMTQAIFIRIPSRFLKQNVSPINVDTTKVDIEYITLILKCISVNGFYNAPAWKSVFVKVNKIQMFLMSLCLAPQYSYTRWSVSFLEFWRFYISWSPSF
jgi:hypothetical protein